MIRPVTVYQIASGLRFNSQSDAAEALADQCRAIIDARLGPLADSLGAAQRFKVVNTLAPDLSGIADLVSLLNAALGIQVEINDDDDDDR